MISLEILLTFVIFLITLYLLENFRKRGLEPKGFPKGPRSLVPLFGGIIWGGREPQKYLLKLRKRWGNVFALDVGSKRTVIVNHYKDYRELASRPECNGRSADKAILMLCAEEKFHGILFNQMGPSWTEQRRFAMRNLRDLGFGKQSMESFMEVEIRDLLESLKGYNGKPILIDHHFNGAIVNSVWAILIGNRFEQNDPVINDLYRRFTADITSFLFLIQFPVFFKIHERFPKLTRFVGNFIKNRKIIFKFMQDIVDKHKQTFIKGSERDFIDRYLREIDEEKDPKSSFYGKTGENNLVTIVHDLFAAGSETTSNLLGWTVHLFALNQKIQDQVFDEIKSQIGISRYANLEDRNSLPFTNATIFELLRWSSILPILPNEIIEDTNYDGMFFPKGTPIIYNNYACLHDPEYWGDPEIFRPERFLAADGRTLVKHDAFIPFHFGKRQCLGESLAKNSLFLFITSIVQRFKITPDPSKPTPKEVKGVLNTSYQAVPFPIIFNYRFEN